MTLSENEYKEYLNTHLDVLYFSGRQKSIFPASTDFKKFLNLDLQIKFRCREALLENNDIVDEYIASNFDHLSNAQVEILAGFRKKIRSNFVILKCLKSHAIFIDTENNNFYAVNALRDPFDCFFETFPVSITTTLIPFKDKIIYDGFFQSQGIYYGRNLTREMNEMYKTAKRSKKIISFLR